MGRVVAVAVRSGEHLVALCRESASQRFAWSGADRDIDGYTPESGVTDPPARDVLRGRIESGARSEPHDLRRRRGTAHLWLWPGHAGNAPGCQRWLGLRVLVLPREAVVLPCGESQSEHGADRKRRDPAAGSGAASCAASRRWGLWFSGARLLPSREQLAPGLARLLAVPVAVFERHPLNLNSCR